MPTSKGQERPSAPWETEADAIVEELRSMVTQMREWHEQGEGGEPDDTSELRLQDTLQALVLEKAKIADRVNRLGAILSENGFDGEPPEVEDQERLSFGYYDTYLKPRKIHRGLLIPVLRRSVLEKDVSETVLAYIAISGEADMLVRENHGGGYHYHYADRENERSDLLIAWDTRASCALDIRGIFGESDHGNGKWRAKPDSWGDKKRASVHAACRKDLSNRQLSDFRCAANDGVPLWPRDAVITPRPVPAPINTSGSSPKQVRERQNTRKRR